MRYRYLLPYASLISVQLHSMNLHECRRMQERSLHEALLLETIAQDLHKKRYDDAKQATEMLLSPRFERDNTEAVVRKLLRTIQILKTKKSAPHNNS